MAHPVDGNYIQEQRTSGQEDQSLGELFGELTREMSTLVRQEVSLAKVEMSSKAADAGRDVGYLAAGAAVAYAGFLAIVAALVIIVAHALPWWLAALLVGIVIAAIGGFLVYQGMQHLKRLNLAPTRTLETLKEDAQWAKDQAS
jgi:uncharacterized membrane protein YqjE